MKFILSAFGLWLFYEPMTVPHHNCVPCGTLSISSQDYDDPERLLSQENVNQDSLLEYAHEAADMSTQHRLPNLEFAHNHYGQPDVAMFDFTSMFAAEQSCRIVERQGHRLLIGLVGDTLLEVILPHFGFVLFCLLKSWQFLINRLLFFLLIKVIHYLINWLFFVPKINNKCTITIFIFNVQPFWPIGSGCARGFLGALDAAWMIRGWASGKMTPLEVMAERESIYQLLSQTTPENLNKNFAQYTIDPNTR